MTPYMFASNGPKANGQWEKPGCGGCHAGGGMLEYDRDGQRYDERLKREPELADSLDGDYYKSKWDKSGVVEIDCFFCHLRKYSFGARNRQLKYQNLKWASVEASGIGQIEGRVDLGEEPKVVYNKRLFNDDGRVVLALEEKPRSENCLLCHGWIDMAKRGTVWEDMENPDVHQLAGMDCNDCHTSGLDHNIAKGDENLNRVRDDLDNSMRTCIDCHATSYKGAPALKHLSLREDHLNKIGCQTCHIPQLNRAAAGAIVVINGPALKFPQHNAKKIGEAIKWKPAYDIRTKGRDRKEKIWPVNPILTISYTNCDADGLYYPLFIEEIKAAYDRCEKKLSPFARDKKVVHTYQDIIMMLSSLSDTLQGNRRFTQVRPCFHKGGTKYSLDVESNLKRERDDTWLNKPHAYSISHNVALPKKALGAGGCTDCHSEGAHIFAGEIVTDLAGPEGKPITELTGKRIGFNALTFKVNFFFQYYITRILPVLSIALVLFLFFLFIRSVGVKKRAELEVETDENSILFNSELWTRLFKVIAFLFLIIAGHLLVFAETGMLNLLVSVYRKTVVYAGEAGIVLFTIAVIFYILIVNVKPTEFVDAVHKRAFWGINIFGIILVVTGTLLMNKEKLTVTTNLAVSSLHGVIAILFLAELFVMVYKGFIMGKKDKPKKLKIV